MDDLEKRQVRRARNRLSQRAYRRRHAERLRELRERAEAGTTSPNEILEKTRKENQLLRKQLCDVQSKLASVTETLTILAGSVTNVLNEDSSEEPPFQGTRVDPSVEPNETTAETDIFNPGPVDPTLSSDSIIDEILQPTSATPATYPPETFSLAAGPATSSAGLDWEAISGNPSALCHQQIPNIWSYGYQMGFQPLYRQVVAVLGLFNSLTRPEAMAWYAKTRFHHIVDLTMWQLQPCSQTLERVEKQYRPTILQLQYDHPKVIDWIPFPSIRDRLIRMHSANPQIDHIFCDLVSSYTVEACMADLVLGATAQKVYIRVLDVAMGAADIKNRIIDPSTVLPAADAGSLFSNPECAQALFVLLNMDHGVSGFKLDPSFFGTYRELFDPEQDYIARGVPLRPNIQTILPGPARLNNLTFQTYQSFMDFHNLALTPFQIPSVLT
ncbi:hypothetical protein PENSTE_c009G04237 [Penicillium steckii]|uniref:BZIP domain-containing protein n=1 Tax=Penicillium steckii TaxID=303698 RepID=A0A1V6TAJ0_9EURO|nr:hypothetical protein PENSTE_c009G04237 [Penicillium steckii]